MITKLKTKTRMIRLRSLSASLRLPPRSARPCGAGRSAGGDRFPAAATAGSSLGSPHQRWLFLACCCGGLIASLSLGYVSWRLLNRGKSPDAAQRPRPAAADLDADLAAHRGGVPAVRSMPQMPADSSVADADADAAEAAEDSLLVARRLEHVRRALANRRMTLANDHLAAAAEEEPPSEAQKIELVRLETLADLLDEFWDAVRATCGELKPGDKLEVAGQKLPVIESTDQTLTVQLGPFPTIFNCENMPLELAIGLAARQTTTSTAHAQAILGALQAMDAAGDRAEAKRLWSEAAAAGEATETLVAELEIPPPTDAHIAPTSPAMRTVH